MIIAAITAAEFLRLISTQCVSESTTNYERNVTTVYKCVTPEPKPEVKAEPKKEPKK